VETSDQSAEATQPRVWALLGARRGDNSQVLALARALGWPFEIKQLNYNRLRVLGPRLLGRSLMSLKRNSRALVTSEPPPDLTISVGHRSVPLVQAMRRRSAGRTRSVHIGFPRISPSHFDLVLTTPQYAVPDGANVLRLPVTLAGAAISPSDTADQSILDALPAPRRLLVVGGSNIYWKIDQQVLMGTLSSMLDEARQGGSVIVTTSPRTPPLLKAKIADSLSRAAVPILLAEPKHPPSYASLLAIADSIRVTAESVAMVSDSIWTGKPMALVPVRKKLLGAALMSVMDRLRPGHRAYPQDLRFFWRAIAGLGVGERLARPTLSGEEQLRQVVKRVQALADIGPND